MTSLQWVKASSGNPAKYGVYLLKENGSSLIVKENDYIHFGDNAPLQVMGFRFSGRADSGEAGTPSSIMYKNKNNEKGECFVSSDILAAHTGYGISRTGLELVQLVS